MRFIRKTKRKIKFIVTAVIAVITIIQNIDFHELRIPDSMKEYLPIFDMINIEEQKGMDIIENQDMEQDKLVSILNDNIPYFTEEEKQRTDAFELYSEPDDLGRCGVAYVNICMELIPTEERGDIGSIKPSGWHTVKYDCVEGRYLYNRCHLIAYCLAGENANEKNLITGTRYFNVNGMLPYETMVAEYMDRHPDNHVLYRVTPVFQNDNLIADGVIMEAWSVEDGGTGICFNVFVANRQPGIIIDYVTGESRQE